MIHSTRWLGVLVLMSLGAAACGAPNIVVILADDFGYGDLAVQNPDSRIPTPNLDALARSGVRFTDAHTPSSVCTPTRYGLLTGRYCWRTRLKRGVLFPPKDAPLIDADRLTIASMLSERGYQTACVGKWHLGVAWGRDETGEVDFGLPIQRGPTTVGFDQYYGIAGSLDMIPYAFIENDRIGEPLSRVQAAQSFPRFVRKGPRAEGFDCGLALDRLTERAVATIDQFAASEEPFFLYFPMTSPHKPVWPAERFQGVTDLGPYGDFVAQTDWSVGQVLEALDRNGVAEETLVLFTSDNGSFMFRRKAGSDHTDDASIQAFAAENHRPNGPYRGTKADIWEAGHRVPFLVRLPGVTEPGSVIESTICHTDVLATLADLVEHQLPANAGEDSYSFLPILRGKPERSHRPPVVHHSFNGTFAIREGEWKLVLSNGSGGRQQPKGKPFGEPFQLYDLHADPGETNDLAAEHPELVARLTETVERFRKEPRSVPTSRD